MICLLHASQNGDCQNYRGRERTLRLGSIHHCGSTPRCPTLFVNGKTHRIGNKEQRMISRVDATLVLDNNRGKFFLSEVHSFCLPPFLYLFHCLSPSLSLFLPSFLSVSHFNQPCMLAHFLSLFH